MLLASSRSTGILLCRWTAASTRRPPEAHLMALPPQPLGRQLIPGSDSLEWTCSCDEGRRSGSSEVGCRVFFGKSRDLKQGQAARCYAASRQPAGPGGGLGASPAASRQARNLARRSVRPGRPEGARTRESKRSRSRAIISIHPPFEQRQRAQNDSPLLTITAKSGDKVWRYHLRDKTIIEFMLLSSRRQKCRMCLD